MPGAEPGRAGETTARGRKRAGVVLRVLASAALACASAGCNGGEGGMDFRHAVVPVLVARATQQDVSSQLQVIGTAEPFSTVGVKAQVGGQVTEIHFHDGDNVKKGELLFTIDPRPYQADLAKAAANLARDQAREAQNAAEEKRWAYMVKEGIGSQERYEAVHADANSDHASVRADQAAVETARLNLEYTQIRSPIDGRVGAVMLHVGNVVKANADDPMLVINQLKPVYVNFAVPESDLAQIRERMAGRPLEVTASIPDQQAEPIKGVLSFVDNTVDRNTGTIKLKGTFENRDERLWPGQYVNVVLKLADRPNTVVVPSQAVQTSQQGQFVYVVEPKMTVELRPVVAGDASDGKTVIERGLKPGETVVTDGQLRLMPGSKVRVKQGLESNRGTAS